MTSYDFIVVGGGSSGAVVAARLSEDPDVTVLLLEAGGPNPTSPLAEVNIPAAASKLQRNPEFDWCYKTTPQSNACQLNLNAQSCWARGKVLGGSSAINYMAYVRGSPADYDGWEADGATGWSWADVRPHFIRSEDCRNLGGAVPSSAAVIDDDAHGQGGPLTTSIREPVNPIAEAFVSACNSAGHATVDYNAGGALGCSLFQTTVRDGQRCSTARAFLEPAAGRRNLTVLTHSHVTRVTIEVNDGIKTAVGVEAAVGKGATVDTERTLFTANKEVILSAGAIGSPHILGLSGVGDTAVLERAGIKSVHHLPGVGASLQDHLMVPMAFRPGYKLHADLTSSHRNVHRQFLGAEQRAEVAALKAKLGDKLEFKPIGSVNAATAQSLGSVWAYLAAGKGPLASSSYDATLMLRTGLNDDLGAFPDMQIGFFCGVADLDAISNMNFPPPTALGLDDHDLSPSAQGFTLCPTLLHPRSRGTVTVVSADPFDPPRIDPDYLSDRRDVVTLIEGIKHASRLVIGDGSPLSDFASFTQAHPKLWPHIDRGTDIIADDSILEELVRDFASTLYHPSSTCRIGDVVDPTLRVKGIAGLRVIDASVMPCLPSANTNAPCIMIGEKGSAMISAEHGLNHRVVTRAPEPRRFGSAANICVLFLLLGPFLAWLYGYFYPELIA